MCLANVQSPSEERVLVFEFQCADVFFGYFVNADSVPVLFKLFAI